ncbi:Lrp/AsnC family transcriptional regulator [Hassallia byssoidea VB512170]|uniref:Lrp/AsnC family transcriptional regulator n=1 Tax=Hassallia byssoidea VB512170 TaxID=1304833 RepID=A0A846HLZ3_9CYAN|nr:Lrp/AsnC family transcriptional regulator [Hassalia byssoidea]NEU77314.1 Lrp/AsnC family transcriptional regulator [Hassalia byssoidea VB512170]
MIDNSQKLIDETSWQILAILQENARIPLKELGKRVGLSSPAVAERVRRLEEAGVITRYRAELNLEKLGLPIMAFITIKSFGHRCDEVRSLLRECPEIESCYRVTGSDHYLAKVSVTSISHLEQLVDRFIPFATVTTSIVLSVPVVGRTIDQGIFPEAERPKS